MSHTNTNRRASNRVVNRRPAPGRRWSLAALVVVGSLTACGDASEAPAAVDEAALDSNRAIEFGLVSPDQAATLATGPGVTVLDVRTPEEFDAGHLAGATMIDFYSATFADDIAALDPEGTYLVYCRSGNRSGQATALMTDLGFDRVYDLDGGIVAWEAQGLDLTP